MVDKQSDSPEEVDLMDGWEHDGHLTVTLKTQTHCQWK